MLFIQMVRGTGITDYNERKEDHRLINSEGLLHLDTLEPGYRVCDKPFFRRLEQEVLHREAAAQIGVVPPAVELAVEVVSRNDTDNERCLFSPVVTTGEKRLSLIESFRLVQYEETPRLVVEARGGERGRLEDPISDLLRNGLLRQSSKGSSLYDRLDNLLHATNITKSRPVVPPGHRENKAGLPPNKEAAPTTDKS
mgnify:CR=1 FL=1